MVVVQVRRGRPSPRDHLLHPGEAGDDLARDGARVRGGASGVPRRHGGG